MTESGWIPVTIVRNIIEYQAYTPQYISVDFFDSEKIYPWNFAVQTVNSIDRSINPSFNNQSLNKPIDWQLTNYKLFFQIYTVKCHYNACHYNANASLTRSILGSQTAPTCPHDHPRVAQHMVYRCEIIAVWSATAAMTPLCSHTNGMKQRHPTCWLCQCSRFMIDLRSNTLIIHLRCSENAINRPVWLTDARMLKTISVAIKLT